jgi:polar amino acid transport system permease protein
VYLAIALVYLVLTQVTNYALHRVERRLRAGGMVQ